MLLPPRGRRRSLLPLTVSLLALGAVGLAMALDREPPEPRLVGPPGKLVARADASVMLAAIDEPVAPAPAATYMTIATPQGDELIVEAATHRLVAVRDGRTRKAHDPYTLAPIPELDPAPM